MGASAVVVDQVTGISVNDTLLHSSFSASGITTVTMSILELRLLHSKEQRLQVSVQRLK